MSKQQDSVDCNAEFKHISLVNPDQTIHPTKNKLIKLFWSESFFWKLNIQVRKNTKTGRPRTYSYFKSDPNIVIVNLMNVAPKSAIMIR